MILLGFWHCYFKSVSLHLPSQAPGQRWITCTQLQSPRCRLFEDDQRVLWDEPTSPAQRSTELHAYSLVCFEQAQGNTAHVTINASVCNDERRPRRESEFPKLQEKPVAGGVSAPCQFNAVHVGQTSFCTAYQYQRKQALVQTSVTKIASRFLSYTTNPGRIKVGEKWKTKQTKNPPLFTSKSRLGLGYWWYTR